MPKRKLAKTPPEVAQAFLDATQKEKGRPLSEAEWEEHCQRMRGIKNLESGVVATKRRGKWVFRKEAGKRGPDYVEHPLTIDIKKRERDHLTELAKSRRRPPVEAATRARQQASKQPKIERLLLEYGLYNRDAPSRIEKKLKVSGSYVRKIRKIMRLTEGRP
jgi:hypothetical protein